MNIELNTPVFAGIFNSCGKNVSFLQAKFTGYSNKKNPFNNIVDFSMNSATMSCCEGSCDKWKLSAGGCCPYPEPNAYIDVPDSTFDCNNPEYTCSTVDYYQVWCEGGSPETGNGCNNAFLISCGELPPDEECTNLDEKWLCEWELGNWCDYPICECRAQLDPCLW
jgi:hypothetical protein